MVFMTMKRTFGIHYVGLYPLVWILETSEKTFFIKDDFGIPLLCYFIYTLYDYFNMNTLHILDLYYRDIQYHVTIY